MKSNTRLFAIWLLHNVGKFSFRKIAELFKCSHGKISSQHKLALEKADLWKSRLVRGILKHSKKAKQIHLNERQLGELSANQLSRFPDGIWRERKKLYSDPEEMSRMDEDKDYAEKQKRDTLSSGD